MRLLNHVRKRIAAHACRWQSLPTLQVRPDPRSDDDREFDSDMDYLDDLADAIDAEMGEAVAEWTDHVEVGRIPLQVMFKLSELHWLARIPIFDDVVARIGLPDWDDNEAVA